MSYTDLQPNGHFSREVLKIQDPERLIESIAARLKADILHRFRRHGAVIGLSGGIDSSVCCALAVRALGADKVLGIMLPERDSSPDSKTFALLLAQKLGIRTIEEHIGNALEGFGCYSRRDEAVKLAVPDFNPLTDKMKIVIPVGSVHSGLPPVFQVKVIFANGRECTQRLNAEAYLQIVAASNFKQRCRMSMLYYHAERLHYAVVGTPNKHEVQQGFFVKHGDGAADIMPIGNLYKSQVYELAQCLGVPNEIVARTPTTDTYSAEQTQEEFFYQLPFHEMDLLWHAWEKQYPLSEVARVMEKNEADIRRIFLNFERKQRTTNYLRQPPLHDYHFI